MSDLENIIARAKKLASFKPENSTEAEVQLAAEILNRLLKEHQLTMADIEHANVGEDLLDEEILPEKGRISSWERMLLWAVTHPLNCQTMRLYDKYQKRGLGRRSSINCMRVIGYYSDVVMAKHLYSYLSRELNRLAREQGRESSFAGMELVSYINSFIVSASIQVHDRLWEQNQKMQESSPKLGALVLLKDTKVADFMNSLFPDSEKSDQKITSSFLGSEDGEKAGKSIPLNKPIAPQVRGALKA